MAGLENLKPDQRASLQLILQQGRTYDEIASLLRIEPAAVQERARSGLDALGPEEVPGLSLERQDEIADYLLGQQSASAREATRSFLAGSSAGRAWARAVSSTLRDTGLAGPDGLPEVPAEAREVDEAFGALQARAEHREKVERSSKVGGIILLVGIGVAVAVILAVILGGDDENDDRAADRPAQTQAAPQLEAQINLRPPQGRGGDALGVATVSRVDGQRVIGIVGQDLPRSTRSFAYAVWLVGPDNAAERLGFTPPVGEDGRLQGFAPLPEDVTRFNRVIVTRETENAPNRPGRTVLTGQLPENLGQGRPEAAPQGEGQGQPQGGG